MDISTQKALGEIHNWFCDNPPDGTNRAERRGKMAGIQNACDQLEPADYTDYVASWQNGREAAFFEENHPALYYLQMATRHAVADIRRTKVAQGLAVWHIYNMGYVFKTPNACFGIDVLIRDSEQLADVLDFLLITHEHRDHWSAPLMDAMVSAGKPVITRWYPGTTIVDQPCEFAFGDCRVKIDIGDHHYTLGKLNDMLMFQVDCGDYTIYHSGDNSNVHKMQPDKNVDVFIPHIEVGMSVDAAIEQLKPRMTLASHVLELGHRPTPPNAWRWSFDHAYEQIKNGPEDAATVLTWGERWLLPGTILQ